MEQLLRVGKSPNSSRASRETAAQFYPTHRTTEIQKIKQQFTDWQTLAGLGMPHMHCSWQVPFSEQSGKVLFIK